MIAQIRFHHKEHTNKAPPPFVSFVSFVSFVVEASSIYSGDPLIESGNG